MKLKGKQKRSPQCVSQSGAEGQATVCISFPPTVSTPCFGNEMRAKLFIWCLKIFPSSSKWNSEVPSNRPWLSHGTRGGHHEQSSQCTIQTYSTGHHVLIISSHQEMGGYGIHYRVSERADSPGTLHTVPRSLYGSSFSFDCGQ